MGLGARLPLAVSRSLTGLGLLSLAFFLNFFRDPERKGPRDAALLLSPADGVVQRVEDVGSEVLGVEGRCVTIFLNVFDVHVQRLPADGRVTAIRRIAGLYKAAFASDVGHKNHRVELDLDTPRGPVRVTQVAGLLARRIICNLKPGDGAGQGERYGMIILGSCVQLFVPRTAQVAVAPGQRVQGGLTVMARYPEESRK